VPHHRRIGRSVPPAWLDAAMARQSGQRLADERKQRGFTQAQLA
jgi:hypothetical protein